MPTTVPLLPVDVRPGLSADEFAAEYINRKPVLMPGAIRELPAVSRWTVSHLGTVAPELQVQVKTGYVADGNLTRMRLADYCRLVAEWEEDGANSDAPGRERPSYLHDVPLLSMVPALRHDAEPFPREFFPHLYRDAWWKFAQVFVGPSGSETPLHFDTLLTHNLFFQIQGRKRWVMVDADDRHLSYPYNWRWSPVDPEAPDLERYPLFGDARLRTCVVEGGDLLYMPPGTLHKVVSETACVSFNLDWHDRLSAWRGVTAVRHGMPVRNLRYNTLMGLGVWAGVPLPLLMPGLRSYFSYVS